MRIIRIYQKWNADRRDFENENADADRDEYNEDEYEDWEDLSSDDENEDDENYSNEDEDEIKESSDDNFKYTTYEFNGRKWRRTRKDCES